MSIVRRPRFVAALAVAVFLALTHAVFPDGAVRAPAQYALVITLGYGHLLGAALPAFRRAAARGTLACAWRRCAAATAFTLYAAAVAAWPPLVLGLVALSVWHIAENDAAMARVLRAGGALRRLPPGAAGHALPLACAALVLALAFSALPDAGRFGDVFSAVTLYHLVAWLAFASARRARRGSSCCTRARARLRRVWLRRAGGRGAARRRLLAGHLPVLVRAPRAADRARARGGVTRAALYEAALCAAFWVALSGYRPRGARDAARFVAGLALGAALARAGGLLWAPAGLFLAAPCQGRARFLGTALPVLPLAFGVAKLGCLAAGCCAAAGGEALGFAAVHAAARRLARRLAAALALDALVAACGSPRPVPAGGPALGAARHRVAGRRRATLPAFRRRRSMPTPWQRTSSRTAKFEAWLRCRARRRPRPR
jgi:hypothetical protein